MVSTFGIGSLFPAENESVMICGLDDWPKGPEVLEPRLAESMGVHTFRLPAAGRKAGDVPVVRFPDWAFCPDCRRLDVSWKLARGDSRRCECTGVIAPSRFVACCPRGHIDDFPYFAWVHGRGKQDRDGHSLKLNTEGRSSALADLVVDCSCGKSRSLQGAFDFNALKDVTSCFGRRPWLPEEPKDPVDCDQVPRTLQRGSSNVWFASTRSAISIPSVRSRARDFAERKFRDANPSKSSEDLAGMFLPPPGCSVEDIIEAIDEMLSPSAGRKRRPSDAELRAEEYRALVNGLDEDQEGSHQFLCVETDLTGSDVDEAVAQISRVSRLREVRALAGFSRVTPSAPEDPDTGEAMLSPLSVSKDIDWLPAVEVLGEGVFVRLDEDKLTQWSNTTFARERARRLLEVQERLPATSLARRFEVSQRTIVLHTLAHALVDEFSLTAGYPAASLRERVYDAENQAGILIYTATADSAGSLGGLAALSDPHRFNGILRSAIKRAEWCTSDPVCIESGPTGVDGMNLCACHACLLLPETSCERFNVVLDRACLVGAEGEDGLFSHL
ncbi:DUF1998 domain-containing protein [Yimella lutea]